MPAAFSRSTPIPSCTVCVLAYNEERNIRATLMAILVGMPTDIGVHVYANGCTDATADVARGVAREHANVVVQEIALASKPNAWNVAFKEHPSDVLVFADGDVVPDAGAVEQLRDELWASERARIATCRQVPLAHDLAWQQRVVGFMQMPLYQDFLAGGFYAIKRHAVAELLAGAGYDGLPVGVTGDDSFLDHLVGADRLLLSESRSAYEPPNFSDFCLYLARIRWQNEQLALLLSAPASDGPQAGTVSRVIGKVRRSGRPLRMVGALASVALKRVFVLIAAPQIDRVYRKLGVVGIDGAGLLGRATRSESTK